VSNFDKKYPFHNYSLGMGAIGLPGDFSSASRFVRVFFVKENSVFSDDEMTNVTQFFHIMNSVAMPKGCVQVGDAFEYTRYTSCCNVDRGIYYYNTYDNPEIKNVSMWDVDLDGKELIY
jgi:choloylglycine hydrolase